ncbi:MAG TPA: hypothetical protein VGB52_13245 [Actinomycetota bacterium]|jgi:hypothetical protein
MSHRARSFVRAALLSVALLFVLATPALAQTGSPEPPIKPTPAEAGGYCAPWHRCVAYAGVGLAVLTLGALGLGYMIQSKGFDRVEHRMGHPQGAPVKKE